MLKKRSVLKKLYKSKEQKKRTSTAKKQAVRSNHISFSDMVVLGS